MSYALDDAFTRAAADDAVRVIVLRGAGRHFSAGHDIGTPERDAGGPFERRTLWWDGEARPGAEAQFVREQEQYLGLCRRWHEIPKPTIAMVQGGCIAGGLMLAWERMGAERALQIGMVNRVVPAARLEAETYAVARRLVQQPRLALALAKQVFNRIEELQGLRASIDMAFGYHHLAHAHNQLVHGDGIGGQDPRAMAAANRGDDPGC